MKYTFRNATSEDYLYCYRLTKRNMGYLFLRHWGRWVPYAFRKGFKVDRTIIFLNNGFRIGYLSIKKSMDGLYIDNIQLSPTVQGKGVGTQILLDMIARYGSNRIALTTFIDNPAMHLYKRIGFEIYDQDGATIRMHRTGTSPEIESIQKTLFFPWPLSS